MAKACCHGCWPSRSRLAAGEASAKAPAKKPAGNSSGSDAPVEDAAQVKFGRDMQKHWRFRALEDKDQQAMVVDFARSLIHVYEDEDPHGLYDDVGALIRYLRARKWNVEAAEVMIRSTARWRKEFEFARIRTPEFKELMTLENATGKLYVRGKDRRGRPVFYMKPALENTFSHTGALQHLVYCMERVVACIERWEIPGKEEHGELPNTSPGKMVLLADFTGYSLFNQVNSSTALAVVSILQNHYPERLGQAFLVNPPFIFNALWTVISPFVDPVTHEKIQFITEDGSARSDKLAKTFDLAQLEATIGGADARLFVSDVFLNIKVDGTEFGVEFNQQLSIADATKSKGTMKKPREPRTTERTSQVPVPNFPSPAEPLSASNYALPSALIPSAEEFWKVSSDPRVFSLSKAQRASVRDLSHRLCAPSADVESKGLFDDAGALIRYLRANKWNEAAAEIKIRSTARWRKEFDFTAQRDGKYQAMIMEEGRSGVMYVRGYDLSGHPIIYVKPGQARPRSEEHLLRLLAYCMERALACSEASELQRRKGVKVSGRVSDGKVVVVMCFDNYSSQNRPAWCTVRRALRILQDHYPERLALSMLLQPPKLVALSLRFISYCVDPETYRKLLVIDDIIGCDVVLTNTFPKSALEKCAGGTNSIAFDTDVFFGTNQRPVGQTFGLEFDSQLAALPKDEMMDGERADADGIGAPPVAPDLLRAREDAPWLAGWFPSC